MSATIKEVVDAVTAHMGQEVTAETEIKNVVKDSLEFIDLINYISDKCGYISDESQSRINTVHDLWEAAIGRL